VPNNQITTSRVRVYLCECGPILKEGLDLDILEERIRCVPEVSAVIRYGLLCSEDGQAWLTQEIAEHKEDRIVIVACSPREHGATFMALCRRAQVNPYLLAIANVREQCAWVTADKQAATTKAELLVRSAIARVLRQQPLVEQEIDCNTSVLVIGAGVAGLTAARQLADGDRQVVLVDRSPAIGGRVMMLGEVFPNLECASCMLEPLIDEVMHHSKIETFSYSRIESIKGYLGNFTVQIRKRARHVNPTGCYGCRTCHSVCPVLVPNEFNVGLSKRGAIYIPYLGALPNASLVDEANCLHFNGGDCCECVETCPFGNIDLDARDEIVERNVGAIILATGAEARFADGRRLPPSVITGMALERLLNSAGPTGGQVRLTAGASPRSLALVYCVDENGQAPCLPCSKICCMSMAKYSHQVHEKLPGCEIHEIFWERCTAGKGFREYARHVDELSHVKRVRLGDTDRVEGFSQLKNQVVIRYTLQGQPTELVVDMAVVVPPMVGPLENRNLSSLLRIKTDVQGFFVEEHKHLRSFCSLVEGVLLAGSAQAPRDVQEAAAHAAAAAGEALSAIVPGRKLTVDPATAEVDRDLCGGCHTCVVSCPYQAITGADKKTAAEVNPLLCRGCGTCGAACPAGAITAKHFTDQQLWAEVEVLAGS
jgi:heterodisulfide reductase subunit A